MSGGNSTLASLTKGISPSFRSRWIDKVSAMSFGNSTNTGLAIGLCIGIVFPWIFKASKFVYDHFIHTSKLSKYQHAKSPFIPSDAKSSQTDEKRRVTDAAAAEPWALITGATDGIGASYARSLSRHGFNIILHGRNSAKLNALISSLSKENPERSFISFVLDASDRSSYTTMLHALTEDLIKGQGLNLTALVNNVGGLGGLSAFTRAEDRVKENEVEKIIDVNTTFPAEITRWLLPILKQNSPALIINICSTMSIQALPYLTVYCGCKAFNWNWGRALRLELLAEREASSISRKEVGGQDFEIEVLNLTLSQVKTAGAGDVPLSLFTPASDDFVENYALQKIGTGWRNESICAYWPHALQAGLLDVLPSRLRQKAMVDAGKQQYGAESKVRPDRNQGKV